MSSVRIWALLAVLVSTALLAWTAVATFTADDLVMPTQALRATQPSVDEAGTGSAAPTAGPLAEDASTQDILRARTQLMRWRGASGPAPGEPAPQAAVGERVVIAEAGRVDNPRQQVQAWWRDQPLEPQLLADGGFISGTSSLPYPNAQVFEQAEGRDWRTRHNTPVRLGGGWWIFGVALVLAVFLLVRGRIPLELGLSGEKVLRFNSIERANHWMTASSFIVMALTGLVILYGKPVLLPLIGQAAFSDVAGWSAWLHMAFAVPFVIGILAMIGLWLLDNLPTYTDWVWLKRLGGFLNDDPDKPAAAKFNAGQKIVFWSVVLSGLALTLSGAALMFPFYGLDYDGMQWAQLTHAVLALLLIGLILGHIYIGTVGMVGAFDAMWSGFVDRNWAREHHKIWFGSIAADERRNTARRQPAE